MPGRHALEGFARDHEEAEDVDLEETPCPAQIHIRNRGLVVDSGVVDHRRDRAELRVDGIEHAHDVVLTAHIRLDGDGALAGFLNFRDDFAGAVFGLAVVDRDIVAARAGAPRDGSTDAAAAARYDHDFRHPPLLPEITGYAPRDFDAAADCDQLGLQRYGARLGAAPFCGKRNALEGSAPLAIDRGCRAF